MNADTAPKSRSFGYAAVPGATEMATAFDNDAFRGMADVADVRVLGCKVLDKIDRETVAAHLLKEAMPSFASLNLLATKHAPPGEYFDGDMERPW